MLYLFILNNLHFLRSSKLRMTLFSMQKVKSGCQPLTSQNLRGRTTNSTTDFRHLKVCAVIGVEHAACVNFIFVLYVK
jgi:hypothetical protein